MPIDILMPALSPTMKEGNLVKWLKNDGGKVKIGDVIAEIETDKAVMEVESVDEGILKILVPANSKNVQVNTIIGALLNEGEEYVPSQKMLQATQQISEHISNSASNTGETHAYKTAPENYTGYFASPLAQKLMNINNVNPNSIRGTGPNGRIVKEDVEKHLANQHQFEASLNKTNVEDNIYDKISSNNQVNGASSKFILDSQNTPSQQHKHQISSSLTSPTLIPHSNMRKVIAQRLQQAKQTIPHFYVTVECKLDKLLHVRSEINSQLGIKLSVNDYIIKASALALRQVPNINASWQEDNIVLHSTIDISVAVALEGGLITPIVTNADLKSVKQISENVRDLAKRAKEGKLNPQEYQGGGFTISNLGMYGVKEFSAIINPPQSAILAVSASQQKPVVVDGRIEIANIMNVTLSCDHRVIDGVLAAQYLAKFTKIIENPYTMLMSDY